MFRVFYYISNLFAGEVKSMFSKMLRERLTQNSIARAFNLDLLGVMKPQELVAKTLFDAAALLTVADVGREFVFQLDLLTKPNVQTFDGIKYVIIVVGADLIINFANRGYWLRRSS